MMQKRQYSQNTIPVILAGLLMICCVTPTTQAAFQDPEAVYLENIAGLQPIKLTVTQTTGVYANRSRSGHLSNFIKGDEVELLAYHEKTSYVRHLKSKKSGWVPLEHLSKMDESKLSSVLAQAVEHEKYAAAIEENEVLAGMTLEQVRKSLGKPDEAAFRSDASGRTDVWTYFEYKSVVREQTYTDPTTGQLLTRRFREKTPEAETNIEFLNGRVTAIEKKRVP